MTSFDPPIPTDVDGLVAKAITDSEDRQILTYVRTTDCRTALARGLKEHLEQQSITWEGGRLLKLNRCYFTWAEPDDPKADLPSLAVVSVGEADYDSSSMSPTLIRVEQNKDERYIRQTSEMKQRFALHLVTQDPAERMGLIAMIEDAMSPAEWMYGLRLKLPYFFGAHATYEPINLNYDDNAADAQRRWRRALMIVDANCPVYRPVGDLPDMRIRRKLEVDDGSDE